MTEVKREKMVAPGKTGTEESEAAADEAKKPGRKITTLAELGPRLPIGMLGAGGLSKDLAQRIWRTREERELGKLRKPKMSMAAYVSTVVGFMYTKFGPHDWSPETLSQKGQLDERRVILGQAYLGDVFYAYMWLRREVIGNDIILDIGCTECGHKFKFAADLGSTEVVTVEEESAMDWFYELRNPIELRKKPVKMLRLRAPRWGALESGAAGEVNEASAKIMTVRGSIVGLNDDPAVIQLMDSEMDELSKRDLETLTSRCDKEFVGPRMAVDITCPKCSNQMKAPIDWSYDRFFSISSQ